MTDLHTHILPGVDDGARSPAESLTLLKRERQQGIDTVVLTPHFYRSQEKPDRFLQRRREAVQTLEEAILALPAEARGALPRRIIGAEVAWAPNLWDWDELPQLCIGGTDNLLLELPFAPWNDGLIHQLYDLMGRTGLTPVIAHLERYLGMQRKEHIRAVLELGAPIQLSAQALLHPLSRITALRLLRREQVHLLASDCHNAARSPNVGDALAVVRKKLGNYAAERLISLADDLTIL